MVSFKREEALVRDLLAELGFSNATTSDPNVVGKETGIDVTVRLANLCTIGIQVTEVDPYLKPGLARGREKAIATTARGGPYGMWSQNNPLIVLDAIARAITRKVKIAAKHPFDGYNEIWLLVCAGMPDAAASTFVMTPWLSADDLNSATDNVLQGSKYDRCFLFPILGAEQALYLWDRASHWKKRVQLEDISQVPRQAYVDSLMKARNQEERDRLCDEECRKVLAELRQT